MLSVHDAATKLGISDARVRALLKSSLLEGKKLGKTWAVSEQSVAKRMRDGAKPGRPKQASSEYERPLPDVNTAHRIYDEASTVLAGCYDVTFLEQARTPEEKAFWIHIADFFLQERQRKLIKEGIF